MHFALDGVGAEGAEKILGIWNVFSLIFFIKSMISRQKSQQQKNAPAARSWRRLFLKPEVGKIISKSSKSGPLILGPLELYPCFGGIKNRRYTGNSKSMIVPRAQEKVW